VKKTKGPTSSKQASKEEQPAPLTCLLKEKSVSPNKQNKPTKAKRIMTAGFKADAELLPK
jgi:hypothetical protein